MSVFVSHHLKTEGMMSCGDFCPFSEDVLMKDLSTACVSKPSGKDMQQTVDQCTATFHTEVGFFFGGQKTSVWV